VLFCFFLKLERRGARCRFFELALRFAAAAAAAADSGWPGLPLPRKKTIAKQVVFGFSQKIQNLKLVLYSEEERA
jgi:hypothetical protein